MNIAIVGLGNAGMTLHLLALAGVPSAQVVGGLDTDPSRRTAADKRFGLRTGGPTSGAYLSSL